MRLQQGLWLHLSWLLFEKLVRYDIRGIQLNIFRSYFTSRKQCVALKNDISDLDAVESGMPQNSVLVPLLFIIYISDFPFKLSLKKCIVYADDTSLVCNNNSKVPLESMLMKYK